MINKNRTITSSPDSFFLGSTSFPTLPSATPPKQGRGTGKRSSGQFITFHLCHSFLLMLFPWSSMGPLPQMQFFKNCSSLGPFHRVQSFRNRLLQCGFPMHHSSCQEPALAKALRRLQLPSGHIHLLWHWVLPQLQCGSLLHCGPPWAATPWSSPQAAGMHFHLFLPHWPWCVPGHFSYFLTPLSQMLCSDFYF